MKKRIFIILFLIILMPFVSAGQQAKKLVRKGNRAYKSEKYQEAELKYRKALEHSKTYHKALFNLGTSLYKQENYTAAASKFEEAGKLMSDPFNKSKAYTNLGNSYLAQGLLNDTASFEDQQEFLKKGIESYKSALKNNPKAEKARYNLIYAKKKLRELMQQQQQQQQQQNQDQDQENQKQENQKQNQGSQENQEKEPKENQGNQQKISKEEMERMLKALENNEKKTQENLNKKKIKAVKTKIEKDW